MQEQQNELLENLARLLKQKQNKQWYANRLGITVDEVNELLQELRVTRNTREIVREDTPTKVMNSYGINLDSYNVNSGWIRDKENNISIQFKKNKEEIDLIDSFKEFLKDFKPKENVIVKESHDATESNSCLVLNIQDAHYDKKDIFGENNIYLRFKKVKNRIEQVLKQASVTTNLQKILYVLGSDIFNAEWTGMTTKGTPQQNLTSYEEGFKAICQNEVDVIELLLTYSDSIEVVYCPGNHDQYVGWHLMTWLQTYFRNQTNLTFDISPRFTKYIKFSNTAMCLNHGDAQKPEVTARNFPIEYKENWSKCDHFYIFGGDRHTELSRDLGGIKFYRIPALSQASSSWDSKNGYIAKAELTAFLIEEHEGMVNIMKRVIK